ncbi:unnamed protein product [Rotaria sp. Silwood2]|nr:unnamed protein product [Rotaria sp. Silwood2]CAF3285824.1 unnamed protein product [Rotaria sp. Silwood2]CAF3561702.1 unnamed protein product [Rotaria sp. Silwood2]CAF4414780.1 unnamed protein product [Rotaria sp. Silwood2]CAF4538765.1 unnamed protein product [Rotaria sp. Silwood2]
MSKEKPTETAVSVESTASTSTPDRAAALSRPVRRRLQNFLLVWLDANLDESNDDFKKPLQQLRRVVASIETFTDAQECEKFLSALKEEKAFMIVSGSMEEKLVPEIEAIPQLESI